jgi:hypothetical protein
LPPKTLAGSYLVLSSRRRPRLSPVREGQRGGRGTGQSTITYPPTAGPSLPPEVRTKNVVRPADTLIRLKVRVAGTGGWVAAVGGSDDECADGSHERPSLGRVKVGRVGPDEVELEDRLLLATGRM